MRFIVRLLASLWRPIIEEAIGQIHRRRIAEADARGYQDEQWFNHLLFGLPDEDSSVRQPLSPDRLEVQKRIIPFPSA